MEPLFNILENLAEQDAAALRAFIDETSELAARIGAAARENDLSEFLVEGRTFDALRDEMTAGVAALEEARRVLAALEAEEAPEAAEVSSEDAESLAVLAELATETEETEAEAAVETEALEAEAATEPEALATEPETPAEPEAPAAPVEAAAEPVTAAAAPPPRRRLAAPARSRAAEPPAAPEQPRVTLTAAGENLGFGIGEELPDARSIAEMMIRRRGQFGTVPEGTHGDRIPIARADWRDHYPEERHLSPSAVELNLDRIAAVTASAEIEREFQKRRSGEGALTASGGLCAPVTPYYALQLLAVTDRPVRAALPSFMADRGGINHARPASLGAINEAVGIVSAADDALGGTFATKTCQRIECPDFNEVDVAAIYHCLEAGNLPSRTYPELIEQYTALTLAAHARMAESRLLTRIDEESTQVDGASLGLGASAVYLSQMLVAATGMRSRHRMRAQTVLRALIPDWLPDLLVSDVYRTQFQRFDMTRDRFIALLRQANIEPSFYIDSDENSNQIFGTQTAGALLSFPSVAKSFLYPEGSMLYLDNGTLELGLVRDSVLNATNDYQFFGETFENLAFVGVESLAITSELCDSGAVSAPAEAPECPISYEIA